MKDTELDWENIRCPVCHIKRMRNSKNNKIFFSEEMSNRKKRRMTFHCTNHGETYIHFVIEVFYVEDQIVSVNDFVFKDKLPKK